MSIYIDCEKDTTSSPIVPLPLCTLFVYSSFGCAAEQQQLTWLPRGRSELGRVGCAAAAVAQPKKKKAAKHAAGVTSSRTIRASEKV